MRVVPHGGTWMPPPSRPGEINYPFMDRFTLIHFGIGIGYGIFRLSFASTIGLAITWEIIENPLKVYVAELFPHATADTWKNSLGDTLAVVCGWLSSSYLLIDLLKICANTALERGYANNRFHPSYDTFDLQSPCDSGAHPHSYTSVSSNPEG